MKHKAVLWGGWGGGGGGGGGLYWISWPFMIYRVKICSCEPKGKLPKPRLQALSLHLMYSRAGVHQAPSLLGTRGPRLSYPFLHERG